MMKWHSGLIRGAVTLACAVVLSAPFSVAHAATIEYTVTASEINLREKPNTSSSVVGVLARGETMTLLSSTGDGWLQVSTAEGKGYVSGQYACLMSIQGSDAQATVLVEKLNIRSSASSDGKVLAVARDGETLDVLGLEGGWLKVRYDGTTGYASPEFVALSPNGGSGETSTPSQSENSSTTGSTLLKKGSRGDAVKALQEKLIKLGYLTGTADGIYGDDTVKAVKAFQRDYNLTADGQAGSATQAALEKAAGSTTVAPSQPGENTGVTLLKKGSTGEEVRALQEKLIELGYLTGTADGKYGDNTVSAVKAFQRAEGLTADGQAGAATQVALAAAYAESTNPSQSTGSTVLKKGSTGDAVKALQEKLIELGYLTGTADGKYGDDTVAAVKAFQRDEGLTADGQAGSATLKALENASPAPGPTQSPDNPISATLLKYGDKGDDVKALQTRLKELGYFNGTVGGNFGTITRDAVKAFQQAAGLEADGIAGQATLNALYADDAPKQEIVALRVGDTGSEVQRLQQRLKDLGYLSGSVDGDFGSGTQSAVMAFQRAAGLTVDGVAGQATLNALYADNAPTASAPADPGNSGEWNSDLAEQIIAKAKEYLGCKYVYAEESPPYFDCSGLTQYVFKQFGYSLLRTAQQQGYNDSYQKLTMSELRMGDLVFFNTNLTDSDMCDHTGIYIGDGDFIHASSSAGKVIISNLNSGYYNQRFSWGRRIID